MTIRILLLASAALGGLACAATARAAETATTTIAVSANVTSSCTVTAAPLNFGSLTAAQVAAGVTGNTQLTVTCTTGASASVDLASVNSPDITNGVGNLKNGISALTYKMFQDSAFAVPWGSGSANNRSKDDNNALLGSGSAQTLTLYAQIPSQTSGLAPGSFTDTVNVTVNF